MSLSKNKLNFITFGCWNEFYCNTNTPNNGLSLVMKALLDDEEIPEFYIVSGDNYYPKKEKDEDKDKKKASDKIACFNLKIYFN